MINQEIDMIKDKIVQSVSPTKVYLFGSFAKNTYTDDSDYDFYVIVPDSAGDQIELSQMAYKSLRGIRKRPVDIIISHESTFENRKTSSTLENSVAQEGVLLYG